MPYVIFFKCKGSCACKTGSSRSDLELTVLTKFNLKKFTN